MAYKKQAIPAYVRRRVILRDKGICRYCGKRGRIRFNSRTVWIWKEHELDHVFPEYLGGKSTAENIVLACRRCNRTKGFKTLTELGWVLIPEEALKWPDEE